MLYDIEAIKNIHTWREINEGVLCLMQIKIIHTTKNCILTLEIKTICIKYSCCWRSQNKIDETSDIESLI